MNVQIISNNKNTFHRTVIIILLFSIGNEGI